LTRSIDRGSRTAAELRRPFVGGKDAHVDADSGPGPRRVGLAPLLRYFLWLGTSGFGGPIALAGAMQRSLVEERRWFSRQEFVDGLALAQLAPGPLAAQLAMYLGFVNAGAMGALAVAIAFVLPSLLMVWALSIAYVAYDGLAWIRALFHGVGAAVIAIIVRSAWKLAALTLGRDRALWAISIIVAVVTAVLEREVVWLFVAAGCVRLAAVSARPIAAPSAGALLAMGTGVPAAQTGSLFWFFAQAGACVFGSGLAIVPFLYGGVVQEHRWLSDRQFLDAVAVAMITPGPVVITVGFVGYLIDGTRGLFAAAAGVFLPVYLFVIIPAPWVRRWSALPHVRAFVEGVTAAAGGAIAGAAVVLGRRAWVDIWSLAIGLVSLAVLWRWKGSELWLIGAAAVVGLWLG
jgi:chromate transporter